ncbi:MAG TPA: biotin/lipoyl-binding protein [Candidatus Limnocylindria bacterium]|jgi:HlyD family secretion protein|nr:biotin/lipoyl-binding protein [Candidatus Limnocylindria bacterium]
MTVLRGILTTWPGRLFALALVAIIAGGAVVASRVSAQPAKQEPRTQAVTKGSVTQSVAVSGSVAALNQVKMSFKTQGKIAAVYVSVGQQVTPGQPLAKLDTTDLESALAQAQANLTTAQNNYNRTASTSGDAQRSLAQARQQAAQDLATAEAALNKLKTSFAAAKTNSTSLMRAVYADIQTYQGGIDTAFTQLDTALIEPTQSGSDFRSAINALYAGLTPLVNARGFSSSLLGPALNDYQRARNDLGVAIGQFDAAIESGSDTSGQSALFSTAMTTYNLAVSRLNGAIDATNGPLSQVSSAVTSAQAFLNSSTSRYNSAYDALRADLATLLTTVTNEQQLASATKTKITQATTYLNTVNDAIGGSLASAMQNVITTPQRGQQSIDSAQSSVNAKPYDIANAQASVDNAAAAVETAKSNLANAVVTAPSAGVVASIASQVGETAANPFMVLANTTSMVLHGTVGESDVAKLKLGLVANVTVDAVGAAARMTGKVTSVDPVATIQQGVPVYGIDVTIDLPGAQVKPGMTGTANVIIASKQGVLTVPNLAIRTAAGRRYVQVLKDGEAVDAEVTFGIANDTVTEVVSGLAEGDLVVLPQARATATTRPGAPGPGGQVIFGR